mgnify:CR=1 FL=1
MKEFDYVIIGGGCAGLSLAYELEIHKKLEDKTLAIIEPREEYKRDKTWSFWKVFSHNFDDCIKKSWNNFTINTPYDTKFVECQNTPYQTIDRLGGFTLGKRGFKQHVIPGFQVTKCHFQAKL